MKKRERKWLRRRWLLMCRRMHRRSEKLRAKIEAEGWVSRLVESYDRTARRRNGLVQFPQVKGVAIVDGAAECPKCQREVVLFAEPSGWTERSLPRWRRAKRNKRKVWRVSDYGPGVGECCDGFLGSQPDGMVHFYEH